MKSPTRRAMAIAAEILSVNRLVGPSGADGEWKWINSHQRASYLAVLQRGDVRALARIFCNMFQHAATSGIFSYEGLAIARDLDEWKKSVREKGNLKTNFGQLPDTPRHDYFAEKLLELKPRKILEIGGGYGGLALQLMRRNPNVRYVDIDLPETLYLAYYFLKRHGLDPVFSLDGSVKSPITFIPNLLAESVAWRPDVVFNCISLSEMNKRTALTYLRLMRNRWKPKYFYHQNSDYLLFPKSKKHIEFLASDFPTHGYSLLYRIPTRWQGGGGVRESFSIEGRIPASDGKVS